MKMTYKGSRIKALKKAGQILNVQILTAEEDTPYFGIVAFKASGYSGTHYLTVSEFNKAFHPITE